jgi:pyrroline-5-carboxylate reductase
LLIGDNKGFIPYVSNYDGDYFTFNENVLEKLGVTKEFDEDMFPLITALSGSGPAWYYELSSQLVNSGQELGLSLDDSEMIIKELVKALPALVAEDISFKDLVNKVKSPKGTTEAGLNSLNNDSFDRIISNAIQKATNKSNEISKELNNE